MIEAQEPIESIDINDLTPIPKARTGLVITAIALILVVLAGFFFAFFVIMPHIQASVYLNLTGCEANWSIDKESLKYGGRTEVCMMKGATQQSGPGDNDLEVLSKLHRVESIDLHGMGITDHGVQLMARLTHLRTLHLGKISSRGGRNYGPDITTKGVAEIAGLQEVKELYLDGHKFDDEAFRLIGTMTSLETLDLSDTGMTDQQLLMLKVLKNLKVLNIERNRVTPSAVAALRRELPSIKELADGTLPTGP